MKYKLQRGRPTHASQDGIYIRHDMFCIDSYASGLELGLSVIFVEPIIFISVQFPQHLLQNVMNQHFYCVHVNFKGIELSKEIWQGLSNVLVQFSLGLKSQNVYTVYIAHRKHYLLYVCEVSYESYTVILQITLPRLTLFRFTSSNLLCPLTSICVVIRFKLSVFGTHCDVNRGITVNVHNFLSTMWTSR